MSAHSVAYITPIWDNVGGPNKNGPSVIGVCAPRLGPNHREHWL